MIHPLILSLLVRGRVQDAVKKKISQAEGGWDEEKRWQIQGELDEIRNQQSEGKLNRGKVLDQLKALQEGIRKRVGHDVSVLSGF